MYQKQRQISKQNQLIDQNFSNNIMLNAIAALENLAFFYGYRGKRIFDYYSGDANRNNENSLINAVIIQLEVFRASHSNYTLNYSEYNFPNNLSKNQIIKYIKEWKQYVIRENVSIYFDEIIRYLNGNSDTSGIQDKINEKKKEWGNITKEDLQKVGRSAPYINSHMFNEMDKIKESYQKTGNYQINAVLNQTKEDNKLMQDLNNTENKLSNQIDKCIKCEAEMEKCFNIILDKIQKNKFTKQDDLEMNNRINDFKISTIGIELEDKDIKEKLQNYQNICNKAYQTGDENIFKIISNYCNSISDAYNRNKNTYFDNK